jgi:hypothetical protein
MESQTPLIKNFSDGDQGPELDESEKSHISPSALGHESCHIQEAIPVIQQRASFLKLGFYQRG